MARVKRNISYKLAKLHDRRSRDLPFNADVAEVEVDNPLALDPDEKIVAMRSIRNDPLGRLHSRRQINEAQYRGGRAYQNDWERAERGLQGVDPTREYVDGARSREPVTESQRQAVLRLGRIERELGTDGAALVHDALVLGLTMDQIGQRRAVRTQAGTTISHGAFANASTGWRWSTVLRLKRRCRGSSRADDKRCAGGLCRRRASAVPYGCGTS